MPYFHTWCGLSVNLGCRSETRCTRLAENTGRKKSPKIRHLGTIAQLCRAIQSTTIGKNVLSSNISSRCSDNMVDFGPLVARIDLVVCGTPGNFNGSVTVRYCSSGRQPNFAALYRERHLYSAGWPSRWALAHISSSFFPYLILAVADWMFTILLCCLSANLECRSKMYCTWLAENTGRKKSPKIFYLLSSNTSSTCPHNIVNFRPTSGWDLFGSLRHPCKFQWVSHFGNITARHSSSGRQPDWHWTEGSTYIRQGGHHVGHWPTF